VLCQALAPFLKRPQSNKACCGCAPEHISTLLPTSARLGLRLPPMGAWPLQLERSLMCALRESARRAHACGHASELVWVRVRVRACLCACGPRHTRYAGNQPRAAARSPCPKYPTNKSGQRRPALPPAPVTGHGPGRWSPVGRDAAAAGHACRLAQAGRGPWAARRAGAA
jgi:hypothetical protein